MAPGRAVLAVLVLVLSTLWMCQAAPPQEPGQHHGELWVWGAAEQARAEPPPLSRRKRDDSGQQPRVTTATRHGHAATTMPSSFDNFPEPDALLGSVPPPAPGTNTSLHRALVVPTTANPWDETDSPDPDLLLSSASPPAVTKLSLHHALAVPTTADPQDETKSPDPDLLLGSVPPPAPGTNTSLRQVLMVLATTVTWDETDSSDPDQLLGSAPSAALGTQASPQTSITTTLSWLMSLGEEGTVTSDMDSISATPPGLIPTTTGYKNAKKAEGSPTPTRSSPWDRKAGGTAAPLPWDSSRVMTKCLLAILLLALVAATFMVCTGVLGALLWRRARSARRQLGPTEMVCISSLLHDSVAATNVPRPIPARRHKLLLDGGPEADGDNLTLSSFLPEQP